MDYSALAEQLLRVRADLLQVPASRQISRLVRGELFVLNYLDTHEGEIHPKELSQKMAVSTARIASLLNRMEERGLILRHPDPHDNRQIRVVITAEGRTMICQVRSEVLGCVSSMLEELGPEDAQAYVRIQKKIWSNSRK